MKRAANWLSNWPVYFRLTFLSVLCHKKSCFSNLPRDRTETDCYQELPPPQLELLQLELELLQLELEPLQLLDELPLSLQESDVEFDQLRG